MTDPRPRIGVVEDDLDLLDHFSALIRSTEDLELTFAVASLAEATLAVSLHQPDLCLVDLNLPDGSGMELIKALKKRPGTKALVITVLGDRRTVIAALKQGADGYVLKSGHPEHLLEDIRQTLAGFTPVSPQIATYMLELLKSPQEPAPGLPGVALTPREIEVLSLFGRGMSYRETASILEISPHTVSDYVKKIYDKLSVNSRSEAVFEARCRGLLHDRPLDPND